MAKNMLVDSRELFTELYRGSPVPYIVIDDQLRVDSVNYAAIRLFGVEEGWLEGKKIFDFIGGEDETRIALIPEYFSQGVFVNNEEAQVLRPDEGTRWVMLSLFSFKDAARKHKGLLTLVDITKQKEIDKAKTEFVSLASHQLRTPISAMKWNIELLKTSGLRGATEGERAYVDKVEHGLVRMEALVADFLSVSKLELGTFAPNFETISLDGFFLTVLEEHEKQAAARRITIEREWVRDETLNTDVNLLSMAVGNLVSNAIKYTKDGGIVRLESFHDAQKHIIRVSDTGIGIPVDEQDRVFSKIFRAENARTQVPDGTGLGLYIVREAVHVLGGEVTFVSKEEEGTIFTVVLPE
jgi:PAS domain S-box-containing protein